MMALARMKERGMTALGDKGIGSSVRNGSNGWIEPEVAIISFFNIHLTPWPHSVLVVSL
jgi:hypothetical protein